MKSYAVSLLLILVVIPSTMGIKDSNLVVRGLVEGKGKGSKKKGKSKSTPSKAKGSKSSKMGTGLKWKPCFQDYEPGVFFDCIEDFKVPLDYNEPGGDKIEIYMARRPAIDTENRIGSLLVNPGGPGGSGVFFGLFLGAYGKEFFGLDVLDRYDIIGFDPRGIGLSTPLECFDNFDDAFELLPDVAFPFLEEDISQFEEFGKTLNEKCLSSRSKILGHTSTANVVRDMDMIREALGEAKLNFYGLSYGTAVGMHYANLFPDNVGALVIDGNIDPTGWANLDCQVPNSNAIRSDQGAQDTLEEFFRQCIEAKEGNCPLAGDPINSPAERVDAVLESIKTTEIVLDELTIDYPFMISYMLGSLYDPFFFWFLANDFVFLEELILNNMAAVDATTIADKIDFMKKNAWNIQVFEGFTAVICSDGCNPTDYQVFFETGKEATEAYGYFGEIWNWGASDCAAWTTPDPDKYTGPFSTVTSTPVLVINPLYDPATRYENGVINNGLLKNSVLLTVDTPGHTSLGTNACAAERLNEYLADPVAYAEKNVGETVCPQELNWFDSFVEPAAASESMSEYRAKLMELIGPL